MTFSEHLLTLRTKNGLLQKDVAKAAGVVVRVYQRYEYGEREPGLSTLVALADFYGISVDELIGHTPRPRTKPFPRAEETENNEQ